MILWTWAPDFAQSQRLDLRKCHIAHLHRYLPPGSILKLLTTPNIGAKSEYAKMQRTEGDLEFKWLVPLEHDSVDTSIVDCEALLKEIESEMSCAFQDADNAGFYINEYTTKVNSMGDKLLQGLRRASEKI